MPGKVARLRISKLKHVGCLLPGKAGRERMEEKGKNWEVWSRI